VRPDLLLIDLRRVPAVTEGAARLFADMVPSSRRQMRRWCSVDGENLPFGIPRQADGTHRGCAGSTCSMKRFEWAEDQLSYRFGGFSMAGIPALTSSLAGQLTEASLPISPRRHAAHLSYRRTHRAPATGVIVLFSVERWSASSCRVEAARQLFAWHVFGEMR